MSKGGLRSPAGGRPVGSIKQDNLKRIKCNMFRLPRWLIDWLMEHSGSMGKIVEEALIEKYKLIPPKTEVDKIKRRDD